jgi:hypothetical protein
MNKSGVAVAVLGILVAQSFADEGQVDIKPAHYGVFSSLGVIDANGDTTKSYGTTGEPIANQPFSRFGGWLEMGATIAERTDISVLLAMMTWNSLPLTAGSPFSRMQSLGSNLGQAYLTHKFGDVKKPFLTLKFGAFSYAYSTSKNLGGHLFTGGTYPGSLTGNFWSLTDGNDYRAQGMLGHFSFLDNTLNVDATGFFEHALEPNYDLSPGLVASYKIADMIEIGGGAVFSHLLAWEDDAVTPKKRNNAFMGNQRLPESEWNKPGLELNDTLIVPEGDPRLGASLNPLTRPDLIAKGTPVEYVTLANNGTPNSKLEYYTFQGTKVMGRVAVTPFNLGEGLNKVSIYSEVTLLGVKDYPFYYEKKSERMPIMFGANVPLPSGFEITGEAEHYKNKFMNNVRTTYENVLPQWREKQSDFFMDSLGVNGKPVGNGQGGFIKTATSKVTHHNGEWFWSVTAKKTMYNRINFTAKMAHDFLRLYNFFGNPSDEPAFQHKDGWYFVFKTEVNL